MVDIPHNPRDDPNTPEHTYCCGTTCDKAKVALQFKQRDKLIAAQRVLLIEQGAYIKQLEGGQGV